MPMQTRHHPHVESFKAMLAITVRQVEITRWFLQPVSSLLVERGSKRFQYLIPRILNLMQPRKWLLRPSSSPPLARMPEDT